MSDNYDGKVNGEVALNLADWIERRRDAVGPYADHIIHSVRAHETEITQLRAELAAERELADRLADAGGVFIENLLEGDFISFTREREWEAAHQAHATRRNK